MKRNLHRKRPFNLVGHLVAQDSPSDGMTGSSATMFRIIPFVLSIVLLFAGCGAATVTTTPAAVETPVIVESPATVETPDAGSVSPEDTAAPEPSVGTDVSSKASIRTDYPAFSPNEMGRIPVVMFHKFVKSFEAKTEKYYTVTFDMFDSLLERLYQDGFRLISMEDFLSGRISVPAGTKPVVFTFDDGTASQFSLVGERGNLSLNPDCAADHLRRFYETHPDFGMQGTFFLNMDMGDNTFPGAGSIPERISVLRNMGFTVGNHTWGHVDFKATGSRADIEKALGRNQKAIGEAVPGLLFNTLALPYGSRPKDETVRSLLSEGNWEGTSYRNDAVFAVGAGPSVTVFDKRFSPLYVERVRATGKVAQEADLDWWLTEGGSKTFFVSDGDPATLVIPEGGDKNLSPEKAAGLSVFRYVRIAQ